ncbi:MAG: hypothetical protein GPOALKHO_001919 [Sodalis sp.]|nr:MAG: hypothetical protein GPOALKHO_001919 [Sodalis sp.]
MQIDFKIIKCTIRSGKIKQAECSFGTNAHRGPFFFRGLSVHSAQIIVENFILIPPLVKNVNRNIAGAMLNNIFPTSGSMPRISYAREVLLQP